MIEQSWEDALEVVVGFLEAPPEPSYIVLSPNIYYRK